LPTAPVIFCAVFLSGAINLAAQTSLPASTSDARTVTLAPSDRAIITSTGPQEMDGAIRRVRENVVITTATMRLTADEVDWNTETGQVEARGNVHFENLQDGQKMSCQLAQYDVNADTGKFFNVTGSAPAKVEFKPGLLMTQNPYYFEGEALDKTKDRYVLHNGFITDCKPEDMWWKLKAKSFDIVPGQRAIAHQSTLVLKDVPIFYLPAFYKSLEEKPRKSGFLTPNIGNSSRRGQVIGGGYFWAINRSYDVTYRTQYYTRRGFVHQADFAGWVNQRSTFDFSIFTAGANQALNLRGGHVINLEARSEIGKGWEARGELRQVSALRFRQEFTQSFAEAINSETHSVGYVTKHWRDYGFNLVAQRNVNYQTDTPGDEIVVRKLPEAQFLLREHQWRDLPIWISLDSSFGLERRTQPLFQTRQFVQRLDIAPRISTAAHWFGLDLAPSFGIRETSYDSKLVNGRLSGGNITRSARDFQFDLGLPRLSRVFNAPTWMRAGDKVKHVIEARARYRNVSGVRDFREIIRFDDTDILSNTNEVEFSLTNRLLRRNGAGGVEDVISWQLWYKRYFDPTFGDAIIPGQRNVLESSTALTGYAFLSGYRNQSPVVSVLRIQSRVGTEWRTDYDPVRHAFVNSTLSVDARFGEFFALISHSHLNTNPVLAPKANQLRGQFQWGNDNRRGFSYGFATGYDYLKGQLQYMQGQTTYNTDCCGFSVQYRRFNFNVISDNQFRVAFAIANIGSFGTLRRQERIF
jgi:LPS-assembly protein